MALVEPWARICARPSPPPKPPDLTSASSAPSRSLSLFHHRLTQPTTTLDLNGTRSRRSSWRNVDGGFSSHHHHLCRGLNDRETTLPPAPPPASSFAPSTAKSSPSPELQFDFYGREIEWTLNSSPARLITSLPHPVSEPNPQPRVSTSAPWATKSPPPPIFYISSSAEICSWPRLKPSLSWPSHLNRSCIPLWLMPSVLHGAAHRKR
ncbi:unnamed protein product [Arabis nemorensis]|uniref:Uncharacterized protein n=1 Tax=Arabis nemorensis TaxID=586526 RepID=A0A565BM85_9BRAS|nr:unnamed protein product [Arabis nemorensis]